jgi:hypothetical protein
VIRQQIIALFLTASVALPSCGLVKTPAEKVSEQIAALSELSPITEAAILEAEEAFEALSEEEQAEVETQTKSPLRGSAWKSSASAARRPAHGIR